jgi:hypothetical protein
MGDVHRGRHEELPDELRPRTNGKHPGGRPRKHAKGTSPHDRQPSQTPELRVELDRVLFETAARLEAQSRKPLDEATIDSIEALILEGNWPHIAAMSLGISQEQYRAWYANGEEQVMRSQADDRDPFGLQAELYLRVSQAQAKWEVATVGDLEEKIIGNSAMWAARMTQLERRDPSRWGRREQHGSTTQTWEEQLRAYLRGRSDESRTGARS